MNNANLLNPLRRVLKLCAGVFPVLVLLVTLLAASLAGGPAYAAPFTCSGDIYQVQSGQLRIFNPITSTYVNVGPKNSSYNATGFNTLDRYAYGSQGKTVIRIENNGTISTLFNVGFSSYAGDVDYNNTLWLRRSASRYDGVNLATGAITVRNLSGSVQNSADVAFMQQAGVNYLLAPGRKKIGVINLDTGVSQTKPITGLPSSGAFGATWTDAGTRLFTFHNNTGKIFEIFNVFGSAPSAQLVATGQPSGNNDGFSCNQASFPNLAPIARDDFFTTPVNTPIGGNVFIDNGGGIDEDPENGALTATTSPISGPSNGSVVIDAAGNFTYTPNNFFVGVDTFVYEITDPTGLKATATVQITVTGTTAYTTQKTQNGGPTTVTTAGQVLNYNIVLRNAGDVAFTGVTVVDTLPDGSTAALPAPTETGASNPGSALVGRLDVGEVWTYGVNYTVTQADIDAGTILTNTVRTTTAETGTFTQQSSVATPVTQTARLSVAKSANTTALNNPAQVGDVITYNFTVQNTGTVTVSGVVPVDQGPNFGGVSGTNSLIGFTPASANLTPGVSASFTATYALSQADIDNAAASGAPATSITNSAIATGTPPSGTTLATPTASAATAGLTATSGLSFTKSTGALGYSMPGDPISYVLTATNTGSVSISNVTFTDTIISPLNCPVVPSLAPSASAICNVTYSVTQNDIDAGSVANTAGASGTDPSGATLSGSDTATVNATQSPAITLDKKLAAGSPLTYGTVGTVLSYDYVITNSGNTTLTGPFSVTDSVINGGAGSVDCSGAPSSFTPGGTYTCTATYAVTQNDIDTGSVANSATATVGGTVSPADVVTVNANQMPSVGVVKTPDVVQPAFSGGNTFTYTYAVTNTGNTTLATPITVADNVINAAGGTVDCSGQPAVLAPNASFTCTGSYVVTVGDVAIGSVTNSAQATINGITSPPDGAVVPAGASPALSLVKTQTSTTTPSAVNDPITYSYLVTNTGNADFASDVTITDDKIGTINCYNSVGGTVPFVTSQFVTCSGTYNVTQADLDAGSVTNVASAASVYAPLGANITVTSQPDTVTVSTSATPGMDVTKQVTPLAAAAVTDILTYTFPVQNTGNQTLTNITVSDPLIPGFSCTIASIAAGLTDSSCSATYTVTQGDVDAGGINNTVAAAGTNPAGTTVSDTGANFKATVAPLPGLGLVKTASPSPFGAVGTPVTFAFAVTNSGNVTISNITVTDPLVPSYSCTIASIAPLTTNNSCSMIYTVTQANIDAGQIINTASADGFDPNGTATQGTGGTTVPGPAQVPSLDIQKTAVLNAGTSGVVAGNTVTYTYRVENTGNVTVSSVGVSEPAGNFTGTGTLPAPSLSTSSTTLSPGAVATFTATYTLTQADIDVGTISNRALATGTPPGGGSVTDDSDDGDDADGNAANDPTVMALPTMPAVTSTKTVAFNDENNNSFGEVGETVTYTYTITNSGNVTLTGVALVEDPVVFNGSGGLPVPAFVSSSAGSAAGVLVPSEVATYRATYTLTNADLTAGSLNNQADANGTPPSGPATSDRSDGASGGGPDDVTSLALGVKPAADLITTKTALPSVVQRGGIATYVVTLENPNGSPAIGIDIIDVLPVGFLFDPGSATVDGNAVTPTVTGREVRVSGRNVGAGEVITLKLSARVPTALNPGTYTNQAYAVDPTTGKVISTLGEADVMLPIVPVFDCSDVIGKVYDDQNQDGYQNQGEPGMPATRLATVRGTLITTDQHGRFHVPCAALPKNRGSNFILKLDTRSLPTGYVVTTENPRVVRLTPGKLTELNFGTSVSRVVRIDLNAKAFDAASNQPGAKLRGALGVLVDRLSEGPSVLTLTYDANGESRAVAKARLYHLERAIRESWRDRGTYDLNIETTIAGAVQ